MKHEAQSGGDGFSRFGDHKAGVDGHSLDRKAEILSGLHAAMDQRVRSRRLARVAGTLAVVLGVGVIGLVSMLRASGGGNSTLQTSKVVVQGEESKAGIESPLAVNTEKEHENSVGGASPKPQGVRLVVEMMTNQPRIEESLKLSAKSSTVELISDDALLEQLRMRGYSAGLLRSGERVMLLEPLGDGAAAVFRGVQ